MSKKILLIEDNLDVRENTAEILELADFEVLTAENGKIGIQLAKENLPELIICDIMMPELDGYGVLHILTRNPDTSNIPFIFLTAKGEKSDFRKGMNMGADDYLTKPFEETDLLDAVESRLRKSDSLRKELEENNNALHKFISYSKNSIESLIDQFKAKSYKNKESIFREGDYANNIYFVIEGKIKTFQVNKDGKEFITGLYSAGDFLGHKAVLEGNNFNETASVIENSEVCVIPRQDILETINENRDVAQKFIKILANDLVDREKQLLDLAYNTVRKRVADALLNLKEKYDTNQEEHFEISVSRADLASMVGTATESVIRILSEFKEDEIIQIKGSKIKILIPEKLDNLMF